MIRPLLPAGTLLAAIVAIFAAQTWRDESGKPGAEPLAAAAPAAATGTSERVRLYTQSSNWGFGHTSPVAASPAHLSPFEVGAPVDDSVREPEAANAGSSDADDRSRSLATAQCEGLRRTVDALSADAMDVEPELVEFMASELKNCPAPNQRELDQALATLAAHATAGDADAVVALARRALQVRPDDARLGASGAGGTESVLIEKLQALANSGHAEAAGLASSLLMRTADSPETLIGSIAYGLVSTALHEGRNRVSNDDLEGLPDIVRYDALRRAEQILDGCCRRP